MRGQYIKDIEKQLDRLWVGSQHICVLKLGKDKFLLSDGQRNVKAKGAVFMRILKKLRDRSGSDKFWLAMSSAGLTVHVSKNPHALYVAEPVA